MEEFETRDTDPYPTRFPDRNMNLNLSHSLTVFLWGGVMIYKLRMVHNAATTPGRPITITNTSVAGNKKDYLLLRWKWIGVRVYEYFSSVLDACAVDTTVDVKFLAISRSSTKLSTGQGWQRIIRPLNRR